MIDAYFRGCAVLDGIQGSKVLNFCEKTAILTPVSGIVNIVIGILRTLGASLIALSLVIKRKCLKIDENEGYPTQLDHLEVLAQKTSAEIFRSTIQILRGIQLTIPLVGRVFLSHINANSAYLRACTMQIDEKGFKRWNDDRFRKANFKPQFAKYPKLFGEENLLLKA